MDIINGSGDIEGWFSEYCKEKKGVDWDWRTTIGYSFVLLWYDSPMVLRYVPV